MDFAKNLLKKYGWKEGEGLGKNNDGISKPLQANFKFDTAGLGVDKASEFNNHWWERVFNDAAGNIDVNKTGESVEIGVKDKDSVEITTKEYSVKKLKKEKNETGYNHFLKKSVLNGLKEETKEHGKNDQVVELPKYKPLTDEELFAACGGRTAHKGARHGLNMLGKLSRIEEQEHELLQRMQGKGKSVDDWQVVSSKKKRKRAEAKTESSSEITSALYSNEYHIKSKKKKKKAKQLDNDLSTAFSSVNVNEFPEIPINAAPDLISTQNRKKKDSQKYSDEGFEISQENTESIVNEAPAKKKKKKKDKFKDVGENHSFLKSSNSNITQEITKKKKKKYLESVTRNLETDLSITCTA